MGKKMEGYSTIKAQTVNYVIKEQNGVNLEIN